jgi:Flp pilus assembly protein TadG
MSALPLHARRDRRGAQAIEFALVMPLLMAFLAATTDYAFYFLRDSSFRNAVHLATRTASATTATDDAEQAFRDALAPRITAAGFDVAQVTTTATQTGAAGDRFLEVSASLPWNGLTGLVPHPDSLGARLRIRLEDQEVVDTGG